MRYNYLYHLYRFPKFRRLVKSIVLKRERGELYSSTLRQIYRDYHQIDIGQYSYGCFNLRNINRFTRVGKYCSFAEGVCIFNGNHPLEHLSMHPFFYNPKLGYVCEEQIERRWLDIGHDVWVGRNSIITPSVKKIGNGVAIGAGSVVTKDIPDFAVAAGNPAKIIKYRFDENTIKQINGAPWWVKDISELQHTLSMFLRPYKTTSWKGGEISD